MLRHISMSQRFVLPDRANIVVKKTNDVVFTIKNSCSLYICR